MKLPTPFRVGLSLFVMAAGFLRLHAQAPAEPVLVEVTNVRFDSNLRGQTPGSNWYEIAIEVEAKPDNPRGSNRHVDRVRVTLNLGIENTADPAKNGFDFYRASAEAVSLESGKSFFRFYLPPEVVKRDGISGNAKFYSIDVEARGKQQAPSRRSTSFTSAPSLQTFQSRIAGEAGPNDGVMQPQYLTPFAFVQGKPAPTFIRLER